MPSYRSSGVVGCDAPDASPVFGGWLHGDRLTCFNVARWHLRKMRICDELEAIADGLPTATDRLKCLLVASQLLPLLRECHAYEEEFLFPAFLACSTKDAARANSINRLKAEHIEDECTAQDLTDALMAIGHGGAVVNPEAVGFMLRGFFDGLRRHVAFEKEYVLPTIPAGEIG